jgi:hypothetical protein
MFLMEMRFGPLIVLSFPPDVKFCSLFALYIVKISHIFLQRVAAAP